MNSRIRRRVREEWRGYREDRSLEDRFVRPSAQVDRILRRLGLDERVSEEQVQQLWREVAGPFLCQHARPTGVRRGTLHIQVLQPTIHYTLEGMRRQILDRFRRQFPSAGIREIRFVLG